MTWFLRTGSFVLHITHLAVIVFSLIGWMIPPLRPAHLLLCLLIAFSWVVLGAFKGYGYCLITDWQWQLFRALGRTDLPSSYMPMLYTFLTGRQGNSRHIEQVTQTVFWITLLLSVTVNLDFLRTWLPA
jgi:hypothetical protein